MMVLLLPLLLLVDPESIEIMLVSNESGQPVV